MPPRHWPSQIVYLDKSPFHSSVSASIKSFIQPSQPKPLRSADKVIIRAITSPNHPAHGQLGLFALKKIPPKTHIIEYIGEIHCDDRTTSDYDLCLHRFQDGLCVGIDAARSGNEARFVNDYRGITDKANARFVDERQDEDGRLRICIWSSEREIKKGEEIVVSYGKQWWSARSNETSCG